jgi:2',3'-cyclic-nucleotide 2'-phosphodiesterase
MKDKINILAIGDIVGKAGRKIIKSKIQEIKKTFDIGLVIANAENAAGGISITPLIADELLSQGIDVITTGNHIWSNKEIELIIDKEARLIRPANYPPGTKGKGYYSKNVDDINICIINLMGRLNMQPIDCPFRKFDEIYNSIFNKADIIVVDFHAEATAEKRAFGWYVDGRASAVFGTHTHVQTADEEILPGGTGYITDAGMTGSFNSVIGMDKEKSIDRFLTFTKVKYEVASGNEKLNGVVFQINRDGVTEKVERIIIL